MSPLLLRAIAAMTIQVISPRAVATKVHNSDLPISSASLTESETDLHKYLLISSASMRWFPRIHGNRSFLVFLWKTSYSFCL
jgi:hypothetical protein